MPLRVIVPSVVMVPAKVLTISAGAGVTAESGGRMLTLAIEELPPVSNSTLRILEFRFPWMSCTNMKAQAIGAIFPFSSATMITSGFDNKMAFLKFR